MASRRWAPSVTQQIFDLLLEQQRNRFLQFGGPLETGVRVLMRGRIKRMEQRKSVKNTKPRRE
jgi:hypothetical protein